MSVDHHRVPRVPPKNKRIEACQRDMGFKNGKNSQRLKMKQFKFH
jgi:hypothetical protein